VAKVTFEYKDFSAGDYGRMEAFRAPKNSWTGLNMLVYRTGEIGVRAGIRDISPTGLATGSVWHLGVRPGAATDFWFGQGTKINRFSALSPGAVTATAASLGGTPGNVAVAETGGTSYIQTNANNGYSFDGTVLTALGSMPNGAGSIAVYGDRLVVTSGVNTNILRWSDAASYNSWPAGNTLTVGDVDYITALVAQRGHLAVMKQNSSFYVLTGVPGVSDTLRAVLRAQGPGNNGYGAYAAAARRTDDLVYYVADRSQYPSSFDGARSQDFDNIILNDIGGSNTVTVIPLMTDDQSGVVINQAASATDGTAQLLWVRSKGAWTKHLLGVSVKKFGAAGTHPYPQDGATLASVRQGTTICLTDGGLDAPATAPKFYAWQPFMDRPGLEANPLSISNERAGDASSTPVVGNFTLPEEHSSSGDDLHVRSVIVDFRKWNTGGATNNHIDVTVNVLRSYGTSGALTSSTQSWDETPGSAALSGTTQRMIFSFGDQAAGGGFQLVFANLRGIAIQRIVVIAESTPPRV
jgi:hypothetical protein